ncbi:MAG: hypothetical protein JO061_11645 [Acidobacteriaceae bacterium]|nr:hypothetical protein [Acidobacteriaceae bacterium]
MATAAQLTANRANAQKSTGPRTPEGRDASSQNNLRHGFCGKFRLFDYEDPSKYFALLAGLRDEHKPSTPTEDALVERMAQHLWLANRAQYNFDLVGDFDYSVPDAVAALNLWMRYKTSNERAFHKCLAELLKLRGETRKAENGFERQKQAEAAEARKEAAEIRKQELHEIRLRTANAKIAALLTKNTAPVHSSGAASVSEHNIPESAAAKS